MLNKIFKNIPLFNKFLKTFLIPLLLLNCFTLIKLKICRKTKTLKKIVDFFNLLSYYVNILFYY